MIAMMALSDEERGFIEGLIVKYGDMMYSKAKSVLKNDDDAEDAVQQRSKRSLSILTSLMTMTSNIRKSLHV